MRDRQRFYNCARRRAIIGPGGIAAARRTIQNTSALKLLSSGLLTCRLGRSHGQSQCRQINSTIWEDVMKLVCKRNGMAVALLSLLCGLALAFHDSIGTTRSGR
jgi:hypothetical protein